jgi:hypothetical protein
VVKFFEYALQLSFKTPLDLLYLSVGILLVSAALYLTKGKETKPYQANADEARSPSAH